MTKLEKAIKVVSDFVTIDGHSEKEEVLFSALQLVVDSARKHAEKK
jgi:hypothetical protein